MKMIDIALKDLKPYENNPRFNDNAVDAVANSIREFGFKVPIVIDSDNVIVAGHTRWKAAKKLRLDSVPCIIADDLTDDQIKAFRLADNKVGELATWDMDMLDIELADIVMDMTQFEFDTPDIDIDDGEAQEDDFDTDKALEEITEPTVKRGQIWKLGDHYLMCGDATSKEDVDKLMNAGE